MKLPGCEPSIVPRSKIEGYLLQPEHPIGGGKAKFFMRFGFRREKWEELASTLRRHASDNAVASSLTESDGVTYVIDGKINTPSGRQVLIRAVWLVETGKLAPRFITAYPKGA